MASDSRKETNRPRSVSPTFVSSVAITCGIPEPEAPGAKRRVHQTTQAVHSGVHTSGLHQARARSAAKRP
ncbi:hypothetical protein GCM10025794_17200 [Massilia kyonggiensis]